MSISGGRLSGKQAGQLPEPDRQPSSAPLVAWLTRVGRYHGVPKSHSMSESYTNSSPSALNARS